MAKKKDNFWAYDYMELPDGRVFVGRGKEEIYIKTDDCDTPLLPLEYTVRKKRR